jgi:hypothetical protein
MIDFIFQIFVLIGTCSIVQYGKILNVPRKALEDKFIFFKEMFKCSMCVGFWVGLFWGLFWDRGIFEWAFFSSFVCWTYSMITDYIEKKIY